MARPSLPTGTRSTPARRALLDALDACDGSFTVIDLFDRARRAYPRLGLATTYRTVELLRRDGTIRPLRTDGRPTYVRCRPAHHHHLVCTACGAVAETELCAAPPDDEVRRRHGFSPLSHEVEIYGLCGRCA